MRSIGTMIMVATIACGERTSPTSVDAAAAVPDFDGGPLACSVSCALNQTCCDRLCVDLTLNQRNCGGCGQACGWGLICDRGQCVNPQLPACTNPSDCNSGCCPSGTRCVDDGLHTEECCPDTDNCDCGPEGCPISSARFKRDIAYLSPEQTDEIREQVAALPLATWRYVGALDDGREHIGFVIEDVPGSAAVDEKRSHVDLYGYASMAIAAVQSQQREIDELREEVRQLRRECARHGPR